MPPKGKQGTKGQKQILEENRSTLNFYFYVSSGAMGIYLTLYYLFFWQTYTAIPIMMTVFAGAVYFGGYQFMASMAKAKFTPDGALIDGGIDLNMESGMAEHAKDFILLTAIVQCLSLLSNYFWLLWLLGPGRAFYMLWVNFIGPWIFAPPPEVDEKKNKKMERKMKRHH